jgi:hypothetical protein
VDDMSNLPALTQPTPEHLDSMPVDTAPVDALLRDMLPVETPSVFAELVCADPELLRAEFEALIAANYPPGDGRRHRRPPRRAAPPRAERARPAPQALSSLPSGWPAGSPSGSGGRTARARTNHAARERGPP